VTAPFSASGIKDNYNRGIVPDFLESHIKDGSLLSVVSAFFRIYAQDALKGYLDRIGHMDFLFGEPRFVRSLDPDRTEKKSFIIDMSGPKLADCLRRKRVAQECADRILKKVSIKLVKQANFLHGKMHHLSSFFLDDLGSRKIDLFKLVEEARPPVLADIPEKQRLPRIEKIGERISDDRHLIRRCLESLKSLEVVHIIEGE